MAEALAALFVCAFLTFVFMGGSLPEAAKQTAIGAQPAAIHASGEGL